MLNWFIKDSQLFKVSDYIWWIYSFDKTGKPKFEVFQIFLESDLLQPGGKQNIKVMLVFKTLRKLTQSLEFKTKSN